MHRTFPLMPAEQRHTLYVPTEHTPRQNIMGHKQTSVNVKELKS